jgi:hypothetical protein
MFNPSVSTVNLPLTRGGNLSDYSTCDQIHCLRSSDRCIDRIGFAAVQLAVNEVLV